MATEAKVGKVTLAVPSNQEYVDGIKERTGIWNQR